MALDGVDHTVEVIAGRDDHDENPKRHEAWPQPALIEAASPGRTQQQRQHDSCRGDREKNAERRRHGLSLRKLGGALVETDDLLEPVEKSLLDVLWFAADAAQLTERLLLFIGQVR